MDSSDLLLMTQLDQDAKEIKASLASYMKQPFDPKWQYETHKRIFEIMLCLTLLIPVSILIGLLSFLIVLESPGPAIFSQVRVGLNGNFFVIHKLRSMKENAEGQSPQWASKKDPRITRIGRFLRQVRLDELPQIYDILKGHMSLIGPRPEVPLLTKEFEKSYPGFVARLRIRPGLTGLAQVKGGYDLSPDEKARIDEQYIQNRGWKLDFKIIGLTLKTLITREGAR